MLSYANRCIKSQGCSGVLKTSNSRCTVRVCASAGADSKFDGFTPKLAVFFPGQGAQNVGMARNLVAEVPKAKELFDKAKDILGYDLLQVGRLASITWY
jgi:[acyl-carrier-protein] S-malonyltransferase